LTCVERGRAMWSVNRSVLVVRPRQPYLDWVHSMDDGGKKYTVVPRWRRSLRALAREM